MIKITPYDLIDILSAAIQFYKTIGDTHHIDLCRDHLRTLRKVTWDEDAELFIDEMPF